MGCGLENHIKEYFENLFTRGSIDANQVIVDIDVRVLVEHNEMVMHAFCS